MPYNQDPSRRPSKDESPPPDRPRIDKYPTGSKFFVGDLVYVYIPNFSRAQLGPFLVSAVCGGEKYRLQSPADGSKWEDGQEVSGEHLSFAD